MKAMVVRSRCLRFGGYEMLVLDRVTKVYHARNLTKQVLQDVNVQIGRGAALAVLGANGEG